MIIIGKHNTRTPAVIALNQAHPLTQDFLVAIEEGEADTKATLVTMLT